MSPNLGAFYIAGTSSNGAQLFRTDGPLTRAHQLTHEGVPIPRFNGFVDDQPIVVRVNVPANNVSVWNVHPSTGALIQRISVAGTYSEVASTGHVGVLVSMLPNTFNEYQVASFRKPTAPLLAPSLWSEPQLSQPAVFRPGRRDLW